MSVFSSFLSDIPDLLAELSPACRDAFAELCAGVSHLRPQTARSYSAGILPGMGPLDRHACREALLDAVLGLSRYNWALTQPFLEALPALPAEDAFIRQWSGLGLELARQDIDVGVAFLKLTPLAMEKLGPAEVLGWGRRGSEALSGDRRMWKAVAAYLRESADPQCGFAPTQWAFFLGQARRIAEASPAAAEAFVQLGRRAFAQGPGDPRRPDQRDRAQGPQPHAGAHLRGPDGPAGQDPLLHRPLRRQGLQRRRRSCPGSDS